MAMIYARHLAETVYFGTPGRISAFHFVDGEDGVFGVVSVKMIVESHYDCGDFLA